MGFDDIVDCFLGELPQLEQGCDRILVEVVFRAAGDVEKDGKLLFKKRKVRLHNGSVGQRQLSLKNHRFRARAAGFRWGFRKIVNIAEKYGKPELMPMAPFVLANCVFSSLRFVTYRKTSYG